VLATTINSQKNQTKLTQKPKNYSDKLLTYAYRQT